MHKIYWFSGTGNTYYLAREFAKLFPGAELISIASLDRSEDVVFDTEITGIFFPVYCFGIPGILARFLDRIQPMKEQGNHFVYAICTSGGYPGAALPLVEDTLQSKNINLSSCFHIRMVSNYIPLSEPPDEKRITAAFSKAERALRIAAIAVKKRKRTRPLRVFPFDTFLKFVARRAVATLETSDSAFHVDSAQCSGCGTCSKICPASNISMDETISHTLKLSFGYYFLLRPGTIDFLKEVSKYYEIIIFTSSQKSYADNILNKIDIEGNLISHRLYKNHVIFEKGKSVKKLNMIGRDLKKTIFIDNLRSNAKYNINNLCPISNWKGDIYDDKLIKLKNKLIKIATCGKYSNDITQGL